MWGLGATAMTDSDMVRAVRKFLGCVKAHGADHYETMLAEKRVLAHLKEGSPAMLVGTKVVVPTFDPAPRLDVYSVRDLKGVK